MAWMAVGAVLSAAGLVSEAKGAAEAKKAGKAQSQALKRQWREDFRTMTAEYKSTYGTQLARYGASGVDLVGSVSTVTQETRDEYHRAVAAEAFMIKQKLKGASAEAKAVKYAQVGSYFSSFANFASSMQQYQQSKGD